MLKKYLRIWWILCLNSFRTQMSNSLASSGYLIGKLVRFGFFLAYLLAIFKKLPGLKGYDMPSVVLFFMTFNLIDVGAQFLFRGLYGVKTLIDEGDFDKILTQPAHVLFRISSMGVDLLDLLTLIPILGVTIWTLGKIQSPVGPREIALYLLLLANAMVITYALHVIVGALSVKTQEFESAIWVYRDIMSLGRFPVTVYADILRTLLVTILPIGVMISFPAQALLGLLSWRGVLYAGCVGAVFFTGAQALWKKALREYTSNSV
jgi:ABC-2 type transport system permease protein